jgi:hypothetical protein
MSLWTRFSAWQEVWKVGRQAFGQAKAHRVADARYRNARLHRLHDASFATSLGMVAKDTPYSPAPSPGQSHR